MNTQQRRDAHPYYMHDAIHGQPNAITRILSEEKSAVGELADLVISADKVHVVGIGTSWHASLVGEHLLQQVGHQENIRAWNSFEFCTYPPRLTPVDLVIVMSHRGTKKYSAQALESARTSGAKTAVVTGIGSDARTDLADVVVRTSTRDPSSAFTISHTSAMTVLAMLASEVGRRVAGSGAGKFEEELLRLPDLVSSALSTESRVKEWAAASTEYERYYFAGWGPNTSTAYEVSLKIKESSYQPTEGFHLEQYLHGPFVATDEGCLVTFIAPPGLPQLRTGNLIEAATAVGARTAAIMEEGDQALSQLVSTIIPMPKTSEPLTPIVYLIPLQLFTYWLAVELGTNPDTFRLDDPKHLAAREKYQL